MSNFFSNILSSFVEFFFFDFGIFDIIFISIGVSAGYRAAEWMHNKAKEGRTGKKSAQASPYDQYKNPAFWVVTIVIFSIAVLTVNLLNIPGGLSASVVATVIAIALSALLWDVVLKKRFGGK